MARIYKATPMVTAGDGTLVQPSFHYQTDVPLGGDEPEPNDVATAIWNHWGSAFRACFRSYHTVHELVVLEEVLKPDIGVAGTHTVNLDGTFAGSGDTMPEGCVPVVNIHSGARSRSARGWTHLPSPGWADAVSRNTWSGGLVTALNSFCDLLNDQLELGTLIITQLNPVVYSRTRRERQEDPYTFRVTSASLNPKVHWLKSRMDVP